ncbi:MAG: tetratricopeptide repeat protein [Myxococcota bacterium]
MRTHLLESTFLVTGLLLGAVTASAAPPKPPEAIEAPKEATKAAVALAKADRMQEAVRYFQRAYDLDSGAVTTAGNLGVAQLALGRYREAATHLAMALERVPPTQEKRRKLLEARFAEAKAQVVALRVKTNVKVGTIYADDAPVQPVGTKRPVFLDPGPHFIQVRTADGESAPVSVQGAAGQDLGVVVPVPGGGVTSDEDDQPEVVPIGPVGEGDDKSVRPQATDRDAGGGLTGAQTATIVMGSLTVVTGATALGLLVHRLGLQSDQDDLRAEIDAASGNAPAPCAQPPADLVAPCADLSRTVQKRRDFSLADNALGWTTFALGLGTAGLLTYVLFFEEEDGDGSEGEAREDANAVTSFPRGVRVAPLAGLQSWGLMMEGRW